MGKHGQRKGKKSKGSSDSSSSEGPKKCEDCGVKIRHREHECKKPAKHESDSRSSSYSEELYDTGDEEERDEALEAEPAVDFEDVTDWDVDHVSVRGLFTSITQTHDTHSLSSNFAFASG
jgi:hypothetical protein